MITLLPPIAHATKASRHVHLPAPALCQSLDERRRNVLRYVLAGARTSHTKSAAWVRRHGTREILAILWRESEWGQTGAHFPRSHRSTAFGLAGFVNQTWRDMGVRKTTDCHAQIEGCFRYCDRRFHGSFAEALAFHRSNHSW